MIDRTISDSWVGEQYFGEAESFLNKVRAYRTNQLISQGGEDKLVVTDFYKA